MQELADHCGGAIGAGSGSSTRCRGAGAAAPPRARSRVGDRPPEHGRTLAQGLRRAVTSCLGVDDTRLLGSPMGTLLHQMTSPTSGPGGIGSWRGDPERGLERTVARADGRLVWMYPTLSVVPDASGAQVSCWSTSGTSRPEEPRTSLRRRQKKMEAVGTARVRHIRARFQQPADGHTGSTSS